MDALTLEALHKGVRALYSAKFIITVFRQTFIKGFLGECSMCNEGLPEAQPQCVFRYQLAYGPYWTTSEGQLCRTPSPLMLRVM